MPKADDEQQIPDVVSKWKSSPEGDLDMIVTLIADDVLFMVPGKEPFGKAGFLENSKAMKDVHIDGVSDIREIEVLGDRAWMRNHLEVTVNADGRKTMRQSGYTLTIFRRNPDGAWVIARDANLLV